MIDNMYSIQTTIRVRLASPLPHCKYTVDGNSRIYSDFQPILDRYTLGITHEHELRWMWFVKLLGLISRDMTKIIELERTLNAEILGSGAIRFSLNGRSLMEFDPTNDDIGRLLNMYRKMRNIGFTTNLLTFMRVVLGNAKEYLIKDHEEVILE